MQTTLNQILKEIVTKGKITTTYYYVDEDAIWVIEALKTNDFNTQNGYVLSMSCVSFPGSNEIDPLTRQHYKVGDKNICIPRKDTKFFTDEYDAVQERIKIIEELLTNNDFNFKRP